MPVRQRFRRRKNGKFGKCGVLIQKSSTVFNNSKTGVNYGKTEKKTSLL